MRDHTGKRIPPPPARTTVASFDPNVRKAVEGNRDWTMRPSTRPGPVATHVTTHEARRLAKTDRYGR